MKGPFNKTLKIFTKADYLKDIEKLCENESYKIKLIDKKKKDSQSAKMVDDAINILKSKPQLLQLYNTIRDFIYLRTKLSETSDFMFYIFRTGLLKEIRNRISLKDDEIVALSIDEIIDVLLNGKDYSKIIIDRKNGYCTLKLKGKWRECFGKEAQKISFNFKALENDKIKNDTKKEICGQIATRGYIVGKVRIIKSLNDLNRVENNDIIVSSMTTPEYTSAIERAGGFITDEGGITCHAAIISREFNIPCIVGTKNATKVLKDGQVVELNALNGTIKY
jgi:phosphohistidine swiveling domain-containing protein